MRFKKSLSTLSIIFACIIASPANAVIIYDPNPSTTIDHDDAHVRIHFHNERAENTMSIGDFGTYRYVNNAQDIGIDHVVNQFQGYIPPNSMITFSLSSPDYSPIYGYVHAGSETTYYIDGQAYHESLVNSEENIPKEYKKKVYRRDTIDGVPVTIETPLTFVSAQFDDGPSKATAYIKNISSEAAWFSINYGRYYPEILGTLTMQVDYEVSAVPLPAALPMFAIGLAGLVGLRSRKKHVPV